MNRESHIAFDALTLLLSSALQVSPVAQTSESREGFACLARFLDRLIVKNTI
jgi:hypothetical protein